MYLSHIRRVPAFFDGLAISQRHPVQYALTEPLWRELLAFVIRGATIHTGSQTMLTGIPELERIAELICRWVDGSISPEASSRLINVAARIVGRRLGGELYSAARSMGTAPETLAIFLITPLLGEQPGPNSQIGRSWQHNPPLDSPQSIVAWLESLVFVTAVRELARRDPDRYRARSRVRRRIRYTIRSSACLLGVPANFPEYVRLKAATELNRPKQQISLDDARQAADRCWQDNVSDAENVEAVVRLLSELPDRCRLIPFALLSQAVIDRETRMDRDDLEWRAQHPDHDPDFNLRLQKAIEKSLAASDPILHRYLAGGKQTTEQSSWMRQGTGQFLRLRALGHDPVQHECLAEFWPGLTRDTYRQNQNIRERFEYVVKVAWKQFEEIWKRDLGIR